jgi:hypothetical protein
MSSVTDCGAATVVVELDRRRVSRDCFAAEATSMRESGAEAGVVWGEPLRI